MARLDIDLIVRCTCGDVLEIIDHYLTDADIDITVKPCPDCIQEAEDVAFDRGHDKGYADGLEDGRRG